jgi:hypothetical protein
MNRIRIDFNRTVKNIWKVYQRAPCVCVCIPLFWNDHGTAKCVFDDPGEAVLCLVMG